jgi:hypothetical protein
MGQKRYTAEQIIGKLRIHELGQLLAALVRGFSPVRESAVEYSQELERAPPGARPSCGLRARRVSGPCSPCYVSTSRVP